MTDVMLLALPIGVAAGADKSNGAEDKEDEHHKSNNTANDSDYEHRGRVVRFDAKTTEQTIAFSVTTLPCVRVECTATEGVNRWL